MIQSKRCDSLSVRVTKPFRLCGGTVDAEDPMSRVVGSDESLLFGYPGRDMLFADDRNQLHASITHPASIGVVAAFGKIFFA